MQLLDLFGNVSLGRLAKLVRQLFRKDFVLVAERQHRGNAKQSQ